VIIEQQRIDKLQIEREIELRKYLDDNMGVQSDLGLMPDMVWDNYLMGTKVNFENRIAAEKKAEEDRIEKIRINNLHQERKEVLIPYWSYMDNELKTGNFGEWKPKAFNELLKDLREEKRIDIEKQEKIKADNERLRKEAEKKESQRLADEKSRLDKEEKERKDREIESEKQRKIAQDKIDAEKKRTDDLVKELQDKKDAEIKAETQRLATIEAEANKGDSAKVQDLIHDLIVIKSKYTFKSKKNQTMYIDVKNLIDKVINHIK